jgi:hypothetical protein
MSFNPSGGPILLNTQSFAPSAYTKGEAMLQWIREKLLACDWTAQKILAHTQFIVTFGIANGDIIVVGGHTFTFTDDVDAPFAVHITPGNTLATLENLGNHTRDDISPDPWVDFTTGTTNVGVYTNVPYIEWTVPDPALSSESYDGNLLPMSITPTGSVGLFDYNPNAVTGSGVTWGGGFILTSSPHGSGGGQVSIKIQTINTQVCDITITTSDGVATFTGIQVANIWNILCNPYQFFLFVTGTLTAGYFFLCSSLKPYGVLTQSNFISGPVNAVSPSGGNRSDLDGIGQRYYVNITGGYTSVATSTLEQVPNFVFPGWGNGITALQKLSNKIAGLDIKRDSGDGIPFEAFIAACLTTPGGVGIGSDKIYIIGALWDSFISSVYSPVDSTEEVDGNAAIALISQAGNTDTSRGTLVVQTED